MTKIIQSHNELHVYQNAMEAAMAIFRLSEDFPKEEKYSLTDQIRRSSRSICANIAEGWRKRRYSAAFTAKLSDAESEANESLVWIDFARRCGYLDDAEAEKLSRAYDTVLAQLFVMMRDPSKWTLK